MPDLTLNTSPFASQAFANISLFDSLIQSDLEDPQLRMCGWEKLKEKAAVGPLNIPMMMRQVEQEVLASGKPLVENINELFERFSVRKAAFDRFESLAPDQKNGVYYHVWDLAGRPETDDPQWGERHAFEHALRFTDALERATQN